MIPSIVAGSLSDDLLQSGSTASPSFSVTVPSSGSNRAFVFIFGYGAGGLPESATLGGVEIPILQSWTSISNQYIGYGVLVDPPTGEQTLIVNFPSSTGNSTRHFRTFTLQDVDQSDPLNVDGRGSVSSGTSISKAVTTDADDCLIVSFLSSGGGTSLGNTYSATELFVSYDVGANTETWGAASKEQAVAGEQTASWSWTDAQNFEIGVFAIKGVSIVYAISGQVTLNGNPVDGATLILIKESDYSVVGTEMSDSSGLYAFSDLDSEETYHVAVEYEADSVKYNAKSLWAVSPVEVE